MSLSAPESFRRRDTLPLTRPSTAPPAPRTSTEAPSTKESDTTAADFPTNASTTSHPAPNVSTADAAAANAEADIEADNPWKYDLEDQLNELDELFRQPKEILKDRDRTHNGTFRLDCEERTTLLKKLVDAVSQYNSFVNEYTQLASRPSVRKEDVAAVRNWLSDHDCAIDDLEAAYINKEHEDDLIPVHPKPRPSILRNCLLRYRLLQRYLSREPSDPLIVKKEGGSTIWTNDDRIDWLSAVVVGTVGLGMLIGPIWALYKVEPSYQRLCIITGFIMAFYFLMVVATTARLFESLAAVAAYSAVLMVFMQI